MLNVGGECMLHNNKRLIPHIVFILILIVSLVFPLPYYIYKPGTADSLNEVVHVDDSFKSEGNFRLVTVRGGRATPLQYLWALVQPYHDIHPMEEVFPEGYDRDEYLQAQLQLMESSQEASIVVAYEAAGKEIDIYYEGVYVVAVIPDMPAEAILETGDKIIAIDGHPITDSDSLIERVNQKNAGEKINLTIDRDENLIEESIELVSFPDNPNQVGIGIQLVTNREVSVGQSIVFESGNIGGPSAGLMLALEIYDQLTEGDLTKGYQIVGTGEINYQGDVFRIGGVDKKVIAADRSGSDIFFVPHEQGRANSNYEVALETAEDIGTSMQIVPVDSFQEAIAYLENL